MFQNLTENLTVDQKFYGATIAMFVTYLVLVVFVLPSTVFYTISAGIAGWQIGGWVYTLARKWSRGE